MHSHFCLSFGSNLTIDVTIVRDEMTITCFNDVSGGGVLSGSGGDGAGAGGTYRKVKFHSDAEFEIFLKMELRRQMKLQKQQQDQDSNLPLAEMTAAVKAS